MPRVNARHSSTGVLVIAFVLAASAFAQLQPQTPGPRIGHSLVYDEHQQRVILLDGYSWVRAVSPPAPPELTELWALKGARWTRLEGSGPASRTMGRAVYDIARRIIVSYGGRIGRGEVPSTDTWEWGADGWRKAAGANDGPGVHIEMAYDAARGRTVKYGGATREDTGHLTWPTDTWEWNGTEWTRVATDGPPGRAAANMVYDSKRREVVLFGGQGAAPADGQPQPVFGDTWIWNGKIWRLASRDGPGPRAFHAMTFDGRAGHVVLHGGNNGAQVFGDMWAWDGARWTEMRQVGTTPGRRRLHALAYDAAESKTVLYGGAGPRADGGTQVYDDTWEWDGLDWARMP
jgi:hypothetical protein